MHGERTHLHSMHLLGQTVVVSRLRQSDDFREGVEAFHGKRKAKFRGSWRE